jgi:hypothetical protein
MPHSAPAYKVFEYLRTEEINVDIIFHCIFIEGFNDSWPMIDSMAKRLLKIN